MIQIHKGRKNTMKKKILVGVLALALSVSLVGCGAKPAEEAAAGSDQQVQVEEKGFQYYTAEQAKSAIENEEDVIFVDIQVEEEWDQHHIEGAVSTKAYPVKSDENKAKLDAVMPQLEGDNPVIVICPRGGGGAERTVAYLKESGVASERLFILENGQAGWPYEALLEQ